jgi:hypothetical protein
MELTADALEYEGEKSVGTLNGSETDAGRLVPAGK